MARRKFSEVSDENDIFQCGQCKMQFTSLSTFISHKGIHYQTPKAKHNVTAIPEKNENKKLENIDEITPVTSSSHHLIDKTVEIVKDPKMCYSNKEIFNSKNIEYFNEHLEYESSEYKLSSVVVSEGELFISTVDANQVYTLPDNLELSTGAKVIDNNSSVFSSSASLALQTDVVKVDEDVSIIESTNGSVNKSTMVTESHDLFHESMAKSCGSKELGSYKKTKHFCSFCDKSFSKNFDLQQHLRSHTGEKTFQCIVCSKAFAQKSNAKKHMSTHKVWPRSTVKRVVNVSLDKPSKNHLKTGGIDEDNVGSSSVSVNNLYECSFCELTFDSYIQVKSHNKIHVDQKVYKCIQKDCKETFIELEAFLTHIRVNKHYMEYECQLCLQTFDSLNSLECHQLEHSVVHKRNISPQKTTSKFYQCTKCKKNFAKLELLYAHLNTDSHNFQCDQCSKIYPSMRLLTRHAQSHDLKFYKCPKCPKTLKGANSLRVHQSTHSDKRPFECNICRMAFARSDRLKRHMLIHREKLLKCPFKQLLGCRREFRRNDKLRLHIISHSSHLKKRKKHKMKDRKSNAKEKLCSQMCDNLLRSFKGPCKENSTEHIFNEKINKIQESHLDLIKLQNFSHKTTLINKQNYAKKHLRSGKELDVGVEEKMKFLFGEDFNSFEEASFETFPESDFIVSYSTEADPLTVDENKDFEVIYLPHLSNNDKYLIDSDKRFNDKGQLENICNVGMDIEVQTGGFTEDNNTIAVRFDENGSLFVDDSRDLSLTSQLNDLDSLNSGILIDQNTLRAIDAGSAEEYKTIDSINDSVVDS